MISQGSGKGWPLPIMALLTARREIGSGGLSGTPDSDLLVIAKKFVITARMMLCLM